MQSYQPLQKKYFFNNRKVNKGLTLLGGLLGFLVGTAVLYFFAISGEYNPRLVIFALFPLAGVMWFSTFDKGNKKKDSSDDYWEFGNEAKVSKFNRPEPSLDLFGAILSLVLAYFSIYLSEVLALTHNLLGLYPDDSFWTTFSEVFTNILAVDWASEYLWRYWLGFTWILGIVLIGSTLYYFIFYRRNEKPGRQLKEEEKAKLAYGSVLFTRNGLSYDYLLGYEPRGRITVKTAKEMLSRDWDIHNKNEVAQTVSELLSSNPSNSLDKLLQEIRSGQASEEETAIYHDIADNLISHYDYTEDELAHIQTLKAWDYDRLVNLVRFAYAAKYLSEQDMWNFVDQIIVQARNDYQTWREYFAAVLLGRSLGWGGNFENSRMLAVKLLNNPNSIYKRYPFK